MTRRLDPTDIIDELSEVAGDASPIGDDFVGGDGETETGDQDTGADAGVSATRVEVAGIGIQLEQHYR